jgi:hypothetical protein
VLAVLRQAAREICRRLMDAVAPALVDQVEQTLCATPGVLYVSHVRLRWIGHHLRAECEVIVDAGASAVQAHQSRSTPSTTCCTRGRGWPPRWCTPTRRPRQAMIIMLSWLPIGEKPRCGWPTVVLCEVAGVSALSVIGRQVLRPGCGRAGR